MKMGWGRRKGVASGLLPLPLCLGLSTLPRSRRQEGGDAGVRKGKRAEAGWMGGGDGRIAWCRCRCECRCKYVSAGAGEGAEAGAAAGRCRGRRRTQSKRTWNHDTYIVPPSAGLLRHHTSLAQPCHRATCRSANVCDVKDSMSKEMSDGSIPDRAKTDEGIILLCLSQDRV
ncbi:hypothetical protein EV126DRAFT_237971 [Verticillium dahliae]|nr:hypothetical protein EV126DRAFT_237971 [Verticillium dahliae]